MRKASGTLRLFAAILTAALIMSNLTLIVSANGTYSAESPVYVTEQGEVITDGNEPAGNEGTDTQELHKDVNGSVENNAEEGGNSTSSKEGAPSDSMNPASSGSGAESESFASDNSASEGSPSDSKVSENESSKSDSAASGEATNENGALSQAENAADAADSVEEVATTGGSNGETGENGSASSGEGSGSAPEAVTEMFTALMEGGSDVTVTVTDLVTDEVTEVSSLNAMMSTLNAVSAAPAGELVLAPAMLTAPAANGANSQDEELDNDKIEELDQPVNKTPKTITITKVVEGEDTVKEYEFTIIPAGWNDPRVRFNIALSDYWTTGERMDPSDKTPVDLEWLAYNLRYYLQLTVPEHEGENKEYKYLESVFSQLEKGNAMQSGGFNIPLLLSQEAAYYDGDIFGIEVTDETDMMELVNVLIDRIDSNTGGFFSTDTAHLKESFTKFLDEIKASGARNFLEYGDKIGKDVFAERGIKDISELYDLPDEEYISIIKEIYDKALKVFEDAGFTVGDFSMMQMSGTAGLTSADAENGSDELSAEMKRLIDKYGYFRTTFKLVNGETITVNLEDITDQTMVYWLVFEKDYSEQGFERQPIIAIVKDGEESEYHKLSPDSTELTVTNVNSTPSEPESVPESTPSEPESVPESTPESTPSEPESVPESTPSEPESVPESTPNPPEKHTPPVKTNNPATGDSSNTAGNLTLLFAAAACLTILVFRRRRA